MTPDDNDIEHEDIDGDVSPFCLPAGAASARLDRALADFFPDVSRSRIKVLIEGGHVTLADRIITDPSHKVLKTDLRGCVFFPAPEDAEPIPQNIPLDIVYEDDDLLVINKSADMVVHPAPGHADGTLVNALLYHCGDRLSGVGGVRRPGIVHRLDRETSGLMLVAKNDRAHHALQRQLADRSMGRIYEAIVFRIPMPPSGSVDKPIGRHPRDRLRMTVGGVAARDAVTHYRTLARFGDVAAHVECELESGRTHQIRVHMASIGHPLLGDPLYGPQGTAVQAALRKSVLSPDHIATVSAWARQALHAGSIHFIHPRTGEEMSFDAEPPADFQDLLDCFGDT
jgi:23S rRNA pseudouridine1911/1915/1917 synthase